MFDDFDRLVVGTILSVVCLMFFLCICYCCPCCLWYKRRNAGTVYHTVDQQIVNAQAMNPGSNIVNQPGAYPFQPGLTAYPPQSYYTGVTQTVVPVAAVPSTNAAGLPVMQHIVVSQGVHSTPYVQPGAYPVQQTLPVGYVMATATSPSMPPPHAGAMPMPMGQPPPYSEVMQMQGAPGGESAHEAYSKQAPFNPHFNQSGP